MLLFTGWKRHDNRLAEDGPCTLLMHLNEFTSHKHIVPSSEQLTIRSFDADQSQPKHNLRLISNYRLPEADITFVPYAPVTAFV